MKRNYRRIFASILTAAIFVNGIGVVGSIETKAVSNRGDGSGTGTGSVAGFASDVFNVVVPTQPDIKDNVAISSIYNFILDPRGWAQTGSLSGAGFSLEPDASVYFKNEEAGAAYDYSHISDPLTIINKSTTKVDVKLKAELQGMEGIKLTGDDTFAGDVEPSVYFALADSNGKTSAIDKYGAFLRTTMEGQPDAYEVIYNSATKKYEYKMLADLTGINFEEYTFRLTGACNSVDDWARIPSIQNTKMQVVWAVSLRSKSMPPAIGKTSYVISKGRPVLVDVDLGSGKRGAKGIKSIVYWDSSGASHILPTNSYTFAVDTLTFNAAYITDLIDGGITSRSFAVTFDDTVETRIGITLTVDDKAPTIAQAEYKMENGQPILVDVDLGSGDWAATGIRAITYTNTAGAKVSLSTDKYSFAEGVLRFRPSYLSTVLGAGVTSREYTVVFNNKAETKVIITLTAEGTAPSVKNQSAFYEINRGSDLAIDIDLGAGQFAATGIKAITYKNSSGVVTNLPVENYTLANNILTIKGDYISKVIDVGVVSRDYTIVFDDVAETKSVITLQAKDTLPSLGTTTYTMQNGQAILVDSLDLGSGASGATGIKAITYVNTSGKVTTLNESNYTFTDGVLRIRPSYIATVLSAGVTTRDYTIVLNDKDETKFVITLQADGTAPSVAVTSYDIERGKAVSVTVDLGAGDLKASGIKTITYKNSSGAISTLTSDKYTFGAGTLTFNSAYISQVIDVGTISRDYTITFDNVSQTKAVITLKAKDMAPSVQTSSYKMKQNQAISINLDLGSGNLRATGIQSITYKNTAGVITSLPTSYYSFANGVLQIRASYVNGVISAGVKSREYTITLNDKAGTKVIVTFEQ